MSFSLPDIFWDSTALCLLSQYNNSLNHFYLKKGTFVRFTFSRFFPPSTLFFASLYLSCRNVKKMPKYLSWHLHYHSPSALPLNPCRHCLSASSDCPLPSSCPLSFPSVWMNRHRLPPASSPDFPFSLSPLLTFLRFLPCEKKSHVFSKKENE